MEEISRLQDRLIAAQAELIARDLKIGNLEICNAELTREISERKLADSRKESDDARFEEKLQSFSPLKNLEISRSVEISRSEAERLRVRAAAAEAEAERWQEKLAAEICRRRQAETRMSEISLEIKKLEILGISEVAKELKRLKNLN